MTKREKMRDQGSGGTTHPWYPRGSGEGQAWPLTGKVQNWAMGMRCWRNDFSYIPGELRVWADWGSSQKRL